MLWPMCRDVVYGIDVTRERKISMTVLLVLAY